MNEVTALGCATCRLSHQGRKGPKTTESFLTPRQPLPSRTEVKLVLLLNRGTGGTIPTPTLPMETQTRNALRLQHLADRRWTRIFSAAETNPGSHQEQHLKQGRDSARDHNEQRGKKKRKWEEGPSGALWCRYAPGRKIWFWVLGQYLTRHQNTQFVVIASPTTH
ncbi:hypothetical protein Bca4012_031971 [Brassica carinata]|uniref:(rape) hypothetical protein n=1 Tax=Brassica napus TaxID=3708 RepID=A0A816JQQ9_BRANA|nr:unnamed protein product [Brassica napus]